MPDHAYALTLPCSHASEGVEPLDLPAWFLRVPFGEVLLILCTECCQELVTVTIDAMRGTHQERE